MVKLSFKSALYLALFVVWGHSRATEPNISVRKSNIQTDTAYLYIFAHGLGAYQKQGIDLYARYKDTLITPNYWIVDEPLVLFDFPDAKIKEAEYYNKLVNLGQQLDIDRLEYVYSETIKQFPDKKIILVGLSRGAATIINFVATKKPPNIAAIILESPFDTLKSVVVHLVKRYHVNWLPYARHLAFKIAKKHFPLLDLNGIFPMQVITKLPSDLPILLIHSRKDKVIPTNSSRKLYVKLSLAGHKNVFFLELKNGAHGKILASPEGLLYQNTLHAFYKKYNLPHDPQFAAAGEQYLVQPTIPDIMLRIAQNRLIETDDDDPDDDDD